ncbi:hypothetical protein HN695_05940 [Candidatus Woesearchaeota archaeon]|jgi:hypothetical protein|nr:hypothetical protein [Candidatus Woesearchaeota archaeon]MBT5272578.1 hypothetical protein [Candidatus Woesearchaeota archaeon]MBT6040565.1 hypothetical protein [Candidatus Woesearchaeota archaeon]MBT6337130.1 hypothetical protein [Candidatus Woesearchaeota archaeon]MBT7927850.1 hypothetical protein [Candidatus Woesearchaeota archaeon]
MKGLKEIIIGALAAVTLYSGCGTAFKQQMDNAPTAINLETKTDYKRTQREMVEKIVDEKLSDDPNTRTRQQTTLGEFFSAQLLEFFPLADYELRENDYQGDKTPGKDLVINGYEKTKDGLFPRYGFNIGSICRSEVIKSKERKGEYLLLTEHSDGTMMALKSRKKEKLDDLSNMLNPYIRNNNDRNCDNYRRFMESPYKRNRK